MADTDQLLYEERNGVAWVTINRPQARNALNEEVRKGLWDSFQRFEASDARVLVLTGSGDRAFSAGGDLKEMAATQLQVPPPDFIPHLNVNITSTKPTIAAVNGVAYAGGFLLAQMCDICVAADHAEFAITEAKWSRGMPWAAPLSRMVPIRIVLELLLTAQPISAQRAYDVGLVNRVVPGEVLIPYVEDLAATIAGLAPLTLRAAKNMVYRTAASAGWSDLVAMGDEIFRPVYESEDAREGPLAFREKRAPNWSAS